MWKRLQAVLSPSKSEQLTISSYGQKDYGIPLEKIQEVMKWLGLSLMGAGYQAKAHIIWDSPEAELDHKTVFKDCLRHHEPTFLYRCGDRPMTPPEGHYWRLMSEYPNLRVYQLERKEN
ncbi:MAG: hypothetical protein AAGC93_25055 [Cyanobacteria bacterium P01_F01_bin.53]